jgi:hypothetical protein
MRRLLWLGLLFLSASWLFFIPEFITPDILVGSIFLIIGILCTIAGLWNTTATRFDSKYLLLFVPLIIALFVLQFPYNVGIFVLTIGLLLVPLSNRVQKTYNVSAGFLLAGLILLVQTAIFPLYTVFIAHGHRIDLFSPVVSWVGTIMGLHTSVNSGVVFVQIAQQTYPFTTTWEKLGFGLWLNLFLGVLLLLTLSYQKRKMLKGIFIFLVASTGYILLRYTTYIYGYLITTDLSIFWNPWYMTLGFLPFSLLLMKLLPLRNADEKQTHVPMLTFSKKHLAAMALVFLMVFSTVGAFTFQDPGTTKNGRVLIDEYHSDWENTTKALDTEWFGLLSTYNYYSWATWLGHYYTVTRNINETLTAAMLNQYDILILKCPTESYTDQEVQAVNDFVENGGGMYLIGDHTNVFGMNTFLNQVSEQFGIRFNTDATYELGTGNLSVYTPDHLIVHPVLQHVTQFEFMTSCTVTPTSLLASATMENIIIGNRVTSEPGTYATENFFRESVGSPDSEYGFLLQVAGIKHGKGRVVAFTDSTVFSSFSMFTDGYPSFTLGVMEYLNRTNAYAFLNAIFLGVSILSFGVLLFLSRKAKNIDVLWMSLFAGLLAFSVAAPSFSYFNIVSYPLPQSQTEYTHVCFDQEHSSINVTLKPSVTLGSDSNNYGTFYVWTQRVGCVPSLQKTLDDAIAPGDIVVIINPTRSFTESDIKILSTYLENGGRVLLMDSIANAKSTANELIGNFGIWITTNTTNHRIYGNETTLAENTSIESILVPYLSLAGGQPMLITGNNETFASMIEFSNTTTGKTGKLVVVVDSYSFSDASMGGTFTEPTNQQRQIYRTEFSLFNEILKK